jgi:hypothetical protein
VRYYPLLFMVLLFALFMFGGWIPALTFIGLYAGMAFAVNHFTRKGIGDDRKRRKNLPR